MYDSKMDMDNLDCVRSTLGMFRYPFVDLHVGDQMMGKGWVLSNSITGWPEEITFDPVVAEDWTMSVASETELTVIEFDYNDDLMRRFLMSEDKFDDEGGKFVPDPDAEGPEEPADDTAEAQPSIEREDAATGRTGSGSPGVGESGGIGSAGNP